MSTIHLVADQGDKAGVSLSIASGAHVNDADGAGETPLHYAAIKGHSEVVVILISNGADPNIKSDRGTTPLHDAAKHGKLDAVTCLVDSGADVESKDGLNKLPIHHAIENGHVKIVNKLLEKNPAPQINNLSKDGLSPLHLAASKGSLPIIKLLIEKGAKLDIRDHKGNTALSTIPLIEKKAVETPQLDQHQLLVDIKNLLATANGKVIKEEDEDTTQTLFSDVTFNIEGTRVYGHRNIIAARCPRLGKLFHHDIIKDEIDLRDINSLVFYDVLEWLYTDDVQTLHSVDPDLFHILKLFQAAERFLLRPLKAYCESLLTQNVSMSNVGQIWTDLRRMTPPPLPLLQHCAQLIIGNWNVFSGTKFGQEVPKEDVIYLCEQVTIAEVKEVVKENVPTAKNAHRSSPKPRTKSAQPPPPVVATAPTHSKSRAAATATTPTPAPAVHTTHTHATPSSSKSTSSEVEARMGGKNFKSAKAIIAAMLKHRFAYPFSQPVDPAALGIPDYFDVISHPMDLSTVKSKLDANKYATVSAFANDVRLIFNNATHYNLPGSEIYNMAETLLQVFNSKHQGTSWEKVGASESLSPVPSPVHSSATNPKKRKGSYSSSSPIPPPSTSHSSNNGVASPPSPPIKEPHTTPSAHSTNPNSSSRGSSSSSSHNVKSDQQQAQPPPVKHKPSPPQMSFEDKRLLGEKMNQLTEDQLSKMVDILNSSKPQTSESGGDIEIDMNELDEVTLRNLETYVNQCLAHNDKESHKLKKPKHKKGAEDEDIVVDDH